MTFSHTPLPSRSHIRLLELQPDEDEDTVLRARLRHVNIDDEAHLPYVALSYTWGIPEFSQLMMVNNQEFRITPNLAVALRQLRVTGCSRWIWVDTLCINQSDGVEKSFQIPLMTTIYRQASRVIAWLGQNENHVTLLKSLRAVSQRIVADQYIHLPGEEKLKACTELLALSRLPWFGRRWILQEAIVNPNVVMVCGNVEVPVQHLFQLLKFVSKEPIDDIPGVLLVSDEGYIVGGMTISHICALEPVKSMSRLWHLWESRSMPFATPNELGIPKVSVPVLILDLLHVFDRHGCSDDRDRISALLPLAEDVNCPRDREKHAIRFNVDYTQNTETVYTAFAEALVRAGLLIHVLRAAVSRRQYVEPIHSSQLPSWVPDWRIPPCKSIGKFNWPSRVPELVRKTECGRYLIVNTEILASNYAEERQANDLGFAAAAQIQGETTATPLKIVWASSYRPDPNESISSWDDWPSNAVLDMWAFVQSSSGCPDVNRLAVVFQTLLNLACFGNFESRTFNQGCSYFRARRGDPLLLKLLAVGERDGYPTLSSATSIKTCLGILRLHLNTAARDNSHEPKCLFLCTHGLNGGRISFAEDYFIGASLAQAREGDAILALPANSDPGAGLQQDGVQTFVVRQLEGVIAKPEIAQSAMCEQRAYRIRSHCHVSQNRWQFDFRLSPTPLNNLSDYRRAVKRTIRLTGFDLILA